jgi:hypothetical protein
MERTVITVVLIGQLKIRELHLIGELRVVVERILMVTITDRGITGELSHRGRSTECHESDEECQPYAQTLPHS